MRNRILHAAFALTLLLPSCSQSTTSPTPTVEPLPTVTATATAQPTAITAVAGEEKQEERVSRFGEYKGYSERIYDGFERFSQYVEARDGTQLAVDVYHPTLDGELVEEPLPVVWAHTRYQRATQRRDGSVQEGYRYVRDLLPLFKPDTERQTSADLHHATAGDRHAGDGASHRASLGQLQRGRR